MGADEPGMTQGQRRRPEEVVVGTSARSGRGDSVGGRRTSGAGGHVGGEDVVGVAVEVVAGAVVAHGGAGVGVPGDDLDITQVHVGVHR